MNLFNIRALCYSVDRKPFEVDALIMHLKYEPYEGQFVYNPEKDSFLEEIAVLEEYRRKGVGSQLIRDAIGRLSAEGYERVFLLAKTDGPSPSRPFCESLGFVPVIKYGPILRDGTFYTLMVKNIKN